MSEEYVESQLDRCRALLDPERTLVTLTETAPERDPASLGALGGIGFEAKDPDVIASVYFFEEVNRHDQAVEQLMRDMPKDESLYVRYCSNGTMLFFGHTRIDGPKGKEARYRLADIISAFAGDEE